MESQPQNPEFKINPENFHTCTTPHYNMDLDITCCRSKIFLSWNLSSKKFENFFVKLSLSNPIHL